MAAQGVAQRGCACPRKEKVSRSRASAKATRGLARMFPLRAPNTLHRMANPIRAAPVGPSRPPTMRCGTPPASCAIASTGMA